MGNIDNPVMEAFLDTSYDRHKEIQNLLNYLKERTEDFKICFREKVIYQEIFDKLQKIQNN